MFSFSAVKCNKIGFWKEKWDLILSDGGSETKQQVLPEQLPFEILTEFNVQFILLPGLVLTKTEI